MLLVENCALRITSKSTLNANGPTVYSLQKIYTIFTLCFIIIPIVTNISYTTITFYCYNYASVFQDLKFSTSIYSSPYVLLLYLLLQIYLILQLHFIVIIMPQFFKT